MLARIAVALLCTASAFAATRITVTVIEPKTGKLVYPTDDTDYLVNADHSNIGPRIGAAWQILPNKLVMRGGYGLFFSGEDIFVEQIPERHRARAGLRHRE